MGVNAGFVASSWVSFSGAALCSWALLMSHKWGWSCLLLYVTFYLHHTPSLAWQKPGPSASEVEDPGGIVGTVWLEERLSVCERVVIV